MSKKPSRIKIRDIPGGNLSLTLLVENNPRIESFYTLNLLTWLGLETVPRKKTLEAMGLLDTEGAKFKLIIVRSVIDKEDTAGLIIELLKKKNLNIPVIIVGPSRQMEGAFAQIQNSMQLKPLIQASAKALGITAKEMVEKVVPDFFPIPIVFFMQLKRSVCNVYIQGLSDPNKYDLHFEKNKDWEETFIKDIIKQGIGTLYVDKMDRLEFVNNLTSEYMTVLKDSDLSEDEKITVTEKGVELLSKKLRTIGITEETIVLAKKSIDSMKKNVKATPKLSLLLQRMLKNQSGYLFKHTQLVTYVALHIVKHIDWGNAEQEEKMGFIAFFHDIALETDAQAQIHSTLELKKANLSLPERMVVEKHAQVAAELVHKYPHSPMGSDQIIRQHHGMLNGVGFSEHYGGNISPAAIVFIVAEEFTRIILRREGQELNQKEMMQELKAEFPTGRFQKVLALIETLTL